MSDIRTNMPEPFSVSELSFRLKRTLEKEFEYVRVRGELSKVKIYPSGHLYTDLKDENSVINSVCWKGVLGSLSIKPEEGLDVICTGKITTYPARSNYQLVIETMELAGQGALLKMLEERKKKLEAEGLFDPRHKKQIPFLPERIGIITSPMGAVIRDILHRLEDRFPRHVLLWPATVQGATTVQEIVTGIREMSKLPPDLRPDVLIIARGGGSLEDLMPFNDEAIVRAVAACPIPTISAIGHETDTTLIDFASDRRAPTPTAAAEMAVPVKEDLRHKVDVYDQRIRSLLGNRLKHDKAELRALAAGLGDPQKIIQTQQQRIDYTGLQAQQALNHLINRSQQSFIRVQANLRHPKQYLDLLTQRLTSAGQLLESYSFKNVLTRGFALVTNKEGHVVSDTVKAKQEKGLNLTFADGSVHVTAE